MRLGLGHMSTIFIRREHDTGVHGKHKEMDNGNRGNICGTLASGRLETGNIYDTGSR